MMCLSLFGSGSYLAVLLLVMCVSDVSLSVWLRELATSMCLVSLSVWLLFGGAATSGVC